MEWPSKCPACGGEIVEKKIEKLLKGGNNTATTTVLAGVCLKCGEHLYTPTDIEKFEKIRRKLEKDSVKEFKVIGKTYAVA